MINYITLKSVAAVVFLSFSEMRKDIQGENPYFFKAQVKNLYVYIFRSTEVLFGEIDQRSERKLLVLK